MLLLHLWGLARAEGFDAHGFQVAQLDSDPRDPIALYRPGPFSSEAPWGGVLMEFADQPLVLYGEDLSGKITATPIVDDLWVANLALGMPLGARVHLDLSAPMYLAGQGFLGESLGARPGDIRLSGTIQLLDLDDAGLGLGLVPFVDMPVGDSAAWLGQSSASGGARVGATATSGRLTASAEAGIFLQPGVDVGNIERPHALQGGLHLGVLATDHLGLNLEARVSAGLDQNVHPGAETPAEALLSLRHRFGQRLFWVAGAGAPLSGGAGAARMRAVAGLGVGGPGSSAGVDGGRSFAGGDPDKDGLIGGLDACPREAEVFNTWEDNDGCPDSLGSLTIRVLRRGEQTPGAAISVDHIKGSWQSGPDEPVLLEELLPGQELMVRAKLGCLAGAAKGVAREQGGEALVELEPDYDARVKVEVVDSKGRPIPEAVVVWQPASEPGCVPLGTIPAAPGAELPVAAGERVLYARAPGFDTRSAKVTAVAGQAVPVRIALQSSRIQVKSSQIATLEPVLFQSGSAVIDQRSLALLDELARYLMSDASILKLEIGGHTDARGDARKNMNLSKERVQAVKAYLVSAGVEESRLIVQAYGSTRPIDRGQGPQADARNRRVEFIIVTRAEYH